MNHTIQTKIKQFAEECEVAKGLFENSRLNLQAIWHLAVRYNKLQNTLSDENDDPVIKTFDLYSEQMKDIHTFAVRAKKAFTRKQWFQLLYMHQSFCTHEAIQKIIL